MCYENAALNYSQVMPDVTSHPNNLPSRCVDTQEYSKYLKYSDTSHHLLNQNNAHNMTLDSNQNYSEHLQPYFAYNYSQMVDSQHSFLPYEKSEYMPSQPMEYAPNSYMVHGDLHRYQQSPPTSEQMMSNPAAISPLSASPPPPLLPTAATQGKSDEEFSGILADVRKTCFSS